MYEHFNPLHLEDAWIQHLLILAVAGVLGYIIGYLKAKNIVSALEIEVLKVEKSLDECEKGLYVPPQPKVIHPAVPLAEPIVAPPGEESPQPVAITPVVVEEDDLKKIEGVGPKIEQLLHEAGIKTFAQLSVAEPAHIMAVLRAAGSRYQIHDPGTWPKQAKLANEGKWEQLRSWQDELSKGKR